MFSAAYPLHGENTLTKMEANRISGLEAIFIAPSLEVALLQMNIVEGSTNLRAAKWGLLDENQQLKWEKLVKDRRLVKDVLQKTLMEISECGTWRSLHQAVDFLQRQMSTLDDMKVEHQRLKQSLTDIIKTLKVNRNQWNLKLQFADQEVALLRDQKKDNTMNATIRLDYADKWLAARAEAFDLRCQYQQAHTPRIDHENQVHEALGKAFQLQIEERKKGSEYWENKYKTDTAYVDLRIEKMRQKLKLAAAQRQELQKIYILHDGEMRAWIKLKAEKAAQVALEERRQSAATSIQAWWRGVMVRRALGSFRYLCTFKKSASKSKKK